MRCAARYLDEPARGRVPAPELTLPDGSRLRASDADAAAKLSRALEHEVTLWPQLPADALDHYRRGAPDHAQPIDEMRAIFGRTADEPLPDFSKFPRELFEYESPVGTYFDAYPLHVVTTATLERLAKDAPASRVDVRRFRPNFVIETAPELAGYVDAGWEGRSLRVGGLAIEATIACPRCVMVTHGFADLPGTRRSCARSCARRRRASPVRAPDERARSPSATRRAARPALEAGEKPSTASTAGMRDRGQVIGVGNHGAAPRGSAPRAARSPTRSSLSPAKHGAGSDSFASARDGVGREPRRTAASAQVVAARPANWRNARATGSRRLGSRARGRRDRLVLGQPWSTRADPARITERSRGLALGSGRCARHRVAEQVDRSRVRVAQELLEVRREEIKAVGRGVVRLLALAVAAAVDPHRAPLRFAEALHPARRHPVVLGARGEAVDEQDRRPARLAVLFEVEPDAVRASRGHEKLLRWPRRR
jgi:hypothetical protein